MITDEQIILKLSSIEDPPVSRGCEFGSWESDCSLRRLQSSC